MSISNECVSQKEAKEDLADAGGCWRFSLDRISRDALKSARAKLNDGRSVRHPHSYFVRAALRDYWTKVEAMTSENEIYAERLRILAARNGKGTP